MAYVKQNLEALRQFLPEHSFEIIEPYLQEYKIQLKLTRARKNILGNFQKDFRSDTNSITVNGDLEPYNFLLTLAHEIAHCVCINKHGRSVASHGKEWQVINGIILKQLIDAEVFPADIVQVLNRNLYAQAASCSDPVLEAVLLKYDTRKQHLQLISSLALGTRFKLENERQFVIVEKRRTRYLCTELTNGKQFLFTASHKVEVIE
jgi:SprT protein